MRASRCNNASINCSFKVANFHIAVSWQKGSYSRVKRYQSENNRIFLYNYALVSTHFFFSFVCILLEIFPRNKIYQILLPNNSVVVRNTDPFHIWNTQHWARKCAEWGKFGLLKLGLTFSLRAMKKLIAQSWNICCIFS